MSHWQDKVALVTGGTRGLGRALVDQLAKGGAKVVFVSRSADDLERVGDDLTAAGCQSLGVVADVTSQDQVESMVQQAIDRFGRLDLLINNAGLSDRGRSWETSPERFLELIELNLLGAVRCTLAAIHHLIESQGQLINVASLAGRSGFPNLGAYPASKFALVGYSHQLRLELAEEGVRVLLVCTGPIQRDDGGSRYTKLTADLPKESSLPGGGVRIKGIEPAKLARKILSSAARGKAELIIPARARLLFAISQLWPSLGDWMLRRINRR